MSGPLFVANLLPGQRFCYHCGYVWFGRITLKPGRCPRCQSRRWDVPGQQMQLRPPISSDPPTGESSPHKEPTT